MLTLKQIFSFSKQELQNILYQYQDKSKYNDLEKLDRVIIHLFNNNKLIEEDSKIVNSKEYNLTIKSKFKNYQEFIKNYEEFSKVNTTSLCKSWKNYKVTTLEGHESFVNNILILNNNFFDSINNKMIINNYLISSSWDTTIKVWNLQTLKCIATLKGHKNRIKNILIFDSFNKLISSSLDNTIKIWDLQTFKCIATLEGHKNNINNIKIENINFDNKIINILISSSLDKTIKIWDLQTFKCIATLQGHISGINNILTFNDKIIDNIKNNIVDTLISSADNIIKIWNLQTFECVATLEDHKNLINKILIKNNILISCSYDKTIKIWSLKNFECIATLQGHKESVNIILVGNDNSLISCSWDKTIKIWDLQSFKCIATLQGHKNGINKILIKSSNNFDYLISCSLDNTIKIWNLQTFKNIITLTDYNDEINNILIVNNKIFENHFINDKIKNSDTFDILISSSEKVIKIWNLQTYELIQTLKGHTHEINNILISNVNYENNTSDINNILISCSWDTTIKVWEKI